MSTTASALRKPVAWRRVALHAGCLAALLVMLYPPAWLLATSLKPADEVIAGLDVLLWQVAPEIADPVLLVVSELVTNAVEHARPPLTLRLSRVPGTGRVRVEVTDGGPAATEGEWAASCGDEEHGRGLGVVDRVAAAHGDRLETGRTIHWADLTTAA